VENSFQLLPIVNSIIDPEPRNDEQFGNRHLKIGEEAGSSLR